MIYATPYVPGGEALGPSVDSGFATLAGVEAAMGAPGWRGGRWLSYGDDASRVMFSDFPCNLSSIDGDGSSL